MLLLFIKEEVKDTDVEMQAKGFISIEDNHQLDWFGLHSYKVFRIHRKPVKISSHTVIFLAAL